MNENFMVIVGKMFNWDLTLKEEMKKTMKMIYT